jgi:hypothetical protein
MGGTRGYEYSEGEAGLHYRSLSAPEVPHVPSATTVQAEMAEAELSLDGNWRDFVGWLKNQQDGSANADGSGSGQEARERELLQLHEQYEQNQLRK